MTVMNDTVRLITSAESALELLTETQGGLNKEQVAHAVNIFACATGSLRTTAPESIDDATRTRIKEAIPKIEDAATRFNENRMHSGATAMFFDDEPSEKTRHLNVSTPIPKMLLEALKTLAADNT